MPETNREILSNLFVLIVNFMLSFLASSIDVFAHLGGLISGLLFGACLLPTSEKNVRLYRYCVWFLLIIYYLIYMILIMFYE